MAAIDDQIESLESVLDSGLSSFTADGQSASWDMSQVRRRLEELKAQRDLESSGSRGFGLRVGRIQYGDANGNI